MCIKSINIRNKKCKEWFDNNKKGRNNEKNSFQKIIGMGADPDDGHHVYAPGDVLWGSRANTGAFEDSDR